MSRVRYACSRPLHKLVLVVWVKNLIKVDVSDARERAWARACESRYAGVVGREEPRGSFPGIRFDRTRAAKAASVGPYSSAERQAVRYL